MSNTTKPLLTAPVLTDNHKNTIRNYIRAKDDNKPHLMKGVFTDSATLAMKVMTDNISFPADSFGVVAITDVLVKNFSQSYENVYTFCVADSFESHENTSSNDLSHNKSNDESNNVSNDISCDWLVCMTERDTGNVRVGAGRYDWRFGEGNRNDESVLANHLVITIEQMIVLAPEYSIQLFEWIGKLPYPFCDSEHMIEEMPDVETQSGLGLEPLELIRTYVSNKT